MALVTAFGFEIGKKKFVNIENYVVDTMFEFGD